MARICDALSVCKRDGRDFGCFQQATGLIPLGKAAQTQAYFRVRHFPKNPARPGRTFAAYESVIRREYLEELRRPLAV